MSITSVPGPITGSASADVLVGLLALAYALWTYQTWRRLSHIPGPFLWSMSPLPMLQVNLGGYSHKSLSELSSRYGPLVRIGPNSVLTTDYRHCQKMEAHKSPYRKGPWYGTFRFQKGKEHSFAMLDEERHSALRTKVGPGYSGTAMVEEAIDRQLTRFFAVIDRRWLSDPAAGGRYAPMDLSVITQFLALDIVGDMTFGAPFGFLDEGEDLYDWIRWNEGFFPIASTCATLPFLARLFQTFPFSEVLPKNTDKVGLGPFIKAAEDAVDAHLAPPPPGSEDKPRRRDMMQIFLDKGATKEEATSEALVQVVAGTDSVAVAIRMAMLYILSTPRVYNALMAELLAAKKAGAISSPLIRDAEAKKLPYLQAVIRESMRVFPSQTPLLNKTVPPGGDTIAGYAVPAGTQVGMDGWGILRSRTHWGADADVFRPERWLEVKDEARREEMAACAEALFGYGRYKCLGRSVAFMQLGKALPEMLVRYHFTVVDPTRPVGVIKSAAFWMMAGFWVTVAPREQE